MARFFGDPVWWLYITWLPLYLYKVRHFSLQEIELFAWMPFVAADAGSLFGGWLSGHLIRRGWTVDRARKSVILGGMVLMCCGIPAAVTRNALSALALIAVVLFGFQSWIGNVQTLCSDYFPQRAVASVMGLGGVGAGLGAMLLTQITGMVVDRFSYMPILIVAGMLPLFATASLFALGGHIRPISIYELRKTEPDTPAQNVTP
jgi:ACS family hexuronate transporter-like MFS transporter